MPVSFLTENERRRLTGFSAEIAEGAIVTHFTLTSADLEQLPRTAAPHNRLGFAVQLGACRYLGFGPDRVAEAPDAVVGTSRCLSQFKGVRLVRVTYLARAGPSPRREARVGDVGTPLTQLTTLRASRAPPSPGRAL